MDTIASEANTSKVTLYSHFESKEKLFSTVILAECALSTEALDTASRAIPSFNYDTTYILLTFIEFLLRPNVTAAHRSVIAVGSQFPQLSDTFYETLVDPFNRAARSLIQASKLNGEAKQLLEDDLPELLSALWGLAYFPGLLQSERSKTGSEIRQSALRIIHMWIGGHSRTLPSVVCLDRGDR